MSMEKGTNSTRESTATPANITQMQQVILDNQHITFSETEVATGLSRNALYCIIYERLKRGMVSVRWEPKIPTTVQIHQCADVCSNLQQCYDEDRADFMAMLMTGNETELFIYRKQMCCQRKKTSVRMPFYGC